MMPEPTSSSPQARPSAIDPLDGEVIPPRIRVVNPERADVPPNPPHAGAKGIRLGTALLAGALVAVVSGAGALEAYRWHLHMAHVASSAPSATAVALARLGKDVGDLKASVATARQDDPVKGLKKSVDQLRAELDGLRSANAASVVQLTAKLDSKPAASSAAPAMAEVAARLDKLDHDPRMADIAARLDRIEHQVSSPAPTGSIVPQSRADASQTVVTKASVMPPAQPRRVKAAMIDNWIVRDVYSGIALVEGRTGSVREVVPGETLPGAGEVRSIERRGRGWIVVTSRGIIDTATW